MSLSFRQSNIYQLLYTFLDPGTFYATSLDASIFLIRTRHRSFGFTILRLIPILRSVLTLSVDTGLWRLLRLELRRVRLPSACRYSETLSSLSTRSVLNVFLDTLAECLEICSQAHPLCKGVSWNADMLMGYGNCYLKNNPDAGQAGPPADGEVTHSAVVTPSSLDVTVGCPEQSEYTSQNGKVNFTVDCYIARTGDQNSTSIHQNSINSCMDECAEHIATGCVGIIFDFAFADGYENCYLLSSLGVANGGGNITFAQVTSSNSTPAVSTTDHHNGNGGSKAWIAGPVIGGIVVLGLLAGVFWWLRRRSSRKPASKPEAELYPKIASEPPLYVDEPSTRQFEMSAQPSRSEMRDRNSERLLLHELG